jgi:hypothetical protein
VELEELAREIHLRAHDRGRTDETSDFSESVARLILKYDANLDFDSFRDHRGITLLDHSGRTVACYPVITVDGSVRCDKVAFSDVLVLVEGSIVLGWVRRLDVTEIDSSFVLSVKNLNRMPKVFDFAQECPHLSVYGGYWNISDDAWECFGCGIQLVGQ